MNLIANEIVSVQPMAGPVSLIFYLDYQYGTTKGSITAGTSAFDARTGPTGNETYSGDVVSNETVYTGDGSTTAFTGTNLARTPVRPGTVSVIAGAISGTDDGAGNITGTGIGSGTVAYDTGAVAVTYSTAPVSAVAVNFTYRYDSEAADNVPQLDLQLTSAPVEALVRKLRGRWSLEAAQNLNALNCRAYAA